MACLSKQLTNHMDHEDLEVWVPVTSQWNKKASPMGYGPSAAWSVAGDSNKNFVSIKGIWPCCRPNLFLHGISYILLLMTGWQFLNVIEHWLGNVWQCTLLYMWGRSDNQIKLLMMYCFCLNFINIIKHWLRNVCQCTFLLYPSHSNSQNKFLMTSCFCLKVHMVCRVSLEFC